MTETHFQVPRAIADKFAAAVLRTADPERDDESGIRIEPGEAPRDAARENRRSAPNHGAPRGGPGGGKPRPHRKGPPNGPRG